MKIISVVGARPNFMKLAPFCDAIEVYNSSNINKITHKIIHTGQHFDTNMSDDFFVKLKIPLPDINLGVASTSQAEQVGHTMIKLEKILIEEKPDWIVVYGDVNATIATAITAKKLFLRIAHIEAGLRSFDNTMPEEINRIVTDRISDLLFTTDEIADKILIQEGTPLDRIYRVGNIMIDSLDKNINKAKDIKIIDIIDSYINNGKNNNISLNEREYVLVTLHRPSNVDNYDSILTLINFMIEYVAKRFPIVWPVHPRTSKKLKEFKLWNKLINNSNFILLSPIGYHEMLRLNMSAKLVITDSGGLQEESTILGTPCLTLRWNTERPMTLKENGGASILVGNDMKKIIEGYNQILNNPTFPHRPPLWDGRTAERILRILINY